MRKFAIPLMLIAFAFLGIISCEKEEFTEEDALRNEIELILLQDSLRMDSLRYADSVMRAMDSIQYVRDSLEDLGGVIQYTLKVLSGGDAGILKSADNAVDGATVTVSNAGVTQTATTTAGTVVFDDMRIGTFNVNVVATDYTELNFVAEITVPSNNATDFEGIDRTAANMVTIFPLTGESLATVSGRVTVETDLTNTAPEIASDVMVSASIDVENSEFQQRFVNNYNHTDLNPNYFPRITHIAYSDIVMRATTDASGLYSLQVPSTADEFGLTYKLQVAEVAYDQTLYMDVRYGETLDVADVRQTVRTIFSPFVAADNIPTVDPVYVTFSDPTGTEFNQPSVEATAVAHIGESGIQEIQISDQGKGYTQAPKVIINGTGEGAEATATLTDGKVTDITMVSEGLGYTPGTTTIDLTEVVDEVATATARVEYEITEINITNAGAGYQSAPAVDIVSAQGSGATALAVMNGYVDDITLSNGGSGYTDAPTVIISGGGGYGATATAGMSTSNRLLSIDASSYTVDTFTVAPTALITTSGTGSGAKASVSLSSTGVVYTTTITDGGAGYIEAPTVTFSGGGGFGATGYSIIAGGAVTAIVITDAGEGYTSAPTITIGAAPTGGTNATATATLGKRIGAFTLTDRGNGYDNAGNVGILFSWDGGTTYTGDAFDGAYDGSTPTVYLDMSVRTVTVTNGGQEFTSTPTVSFVPVGMEGSGAAATASIAYDLDEIQVTNGGSGYRSGEDAIYVNIEAPPAGGTLATADAVEGNGVVVNVTVVDEGLGYTAAPIVELTGGGPDAVQAELTAIVAGGVITGFTIDDPGSGYTADPSITISTFEDAAVATATVNLTAGQIEWIEVTNPGEGYSIVPAVEIIAKDNLLNDVVHFGSGATATAVLDVESGRILEITVDDAGSGYYRAPEVKLTIPAYNSPAKGTANVNSEGVVTSVTVNDAGNGYVEEPTITFTGVDGIGFGAEAIVRVEGGQVQEVVMTDGGSGYTAKNTPGNYEPDNPADAAGINYSIYGGHASTTLTVVNGQMYIRDIYLGTGDRVEEY